jgi:hypothetical protein
MRPARRQDLPFSRAFVGVTAPQIRDICVKNLRQDVI